MADGHDGGGGYGKPPKKHQFKPGESGNPGGKKKAKPPAKSFLEEFLEEVEKPVSFIQGGKTVKTTRRLALILKMINGGLTSDHRCLKLCMDLLIRADTARDAGEAPEISDSDYQALLAILKEQKECDGDG